MFKNTDGTTKDVSTHSRTEAAAAPEWLCVLEDAVSTHSRTEAAARTNQIHGGVDRSFNTQPHGGGCALCAISGHAGRVVSTHSRTEAAAEAIRLFKIKALVSTHSRTEAAAQS